MSDPPPRCADCGLWSGKALLFRHGDLWLCRACQDRNHDALCPNDAAAMLLEAARLNEPGGTHDA